MQMRHLILAVVCVGFCVTFVASTLTAAEIPRKVNYQGRLTNSVSGHPLPGPHTMVFRIYNQEIGGTAVWSESRLLNADSSGVVSVILGADTPIDIAFTGAMWLEVEVDGEVLTPRREMVSVPYAFYAADAGHAEDADSLGGLSAESYVYEGESSVITGDMIVDGSGSGLDADLLDGMSSSAFADSAHLHDDRYYTESELNSPGSINSGGNPVDWTKLKNVPGGFADGTDDMGSGDGHSLDAADGNPVNVVYVNNAGNVGIGTTTPSELLDVDGDMRIDFAHGILFGNDATKVYHSGNDLYAQATDDIYLQPSDDVLIGSDAGDYVIFEGAKKRVGINNLSPAYALDVAGQAYITSPSGTPLFLRASGQAWIDFETSSTNLIGISLKNSTRRWTLAGGGGSFDRFTLRNATGGSRTAISIDGPSNNIGFWTEDPDTGSVLTVDATQRTRGITIQNGGFFGLIAEFPGIYNGAAVQGVNEGEWGAAIRGRATGSCQSAVHGWGSSGVEYAIYGQADGADYAGYFDGKVGIEDDSGDGQRVLDIQHEPSTSQGYRTANIQLTGSPQSFHDMLQMKAPTGSPSDFQFIECERGADIEFQINGSGDVYADGTWHIPATDFAEMVAVSSGAAAVEPGDVMVVDRAAYRSIQRSSDPRSSLVAGIYSTKPGFVAADREWDRPISLEAGEGSEGGSEDRVVYTIQDMAAEFDEIPLAVVGIVPCKVSAENGPIAPGDLLVTSGTPGHAMRDDDPRIGTVVGKALERLDSGTGLIKVLVTLQ